MDYFTSIPWCATVLNDPSIILFTPPCRLQVDEHGNCPTQDQLVRRTFHNSDGIPHIVAFHPKHCARSVHAPSSTKGLRFLVDSITLMLDLRSGLNGYNGGAHGGLIATIIDEAMGTLIFQNHEVYKEMEERKEAVPGHVLNMHGLALFTATMNVRYEKPVGTPQVVLAIASLDRIEGRKVYLRVVIQDGRAKPLARGEGIWLSVPRRGGEARNKI
ncbi:hypothetical protein K505DRAFT_260264 [Melanomma pulvis-pyrius CBS 109.77]|uniref:Thioesterase domain-containing protein n=1 Tax=Melanomma pulvis-pyrius CBS 109.77 TaxID=1314802 RepID=A0A6A6WQL2_9PLEO|nr:hypothetical protein K505DRAFT_260264 [Melanomma pulvis-pyrius CBS 109.77]